MDLDIAGYMSNIGLSKLRFFMKKKDSTIENFYLAIREGVLTIGVNLVRVSVNEAAELRNLLEEQIVLGYSKIVVDLSQCAQLDSTFIGVLVVTQKSLLTNGGELKIVAPPDPANEMFYLAGTSNVFDTFEAAEDAVKSFIKELKPAEPKPDDDTLIKNVPWTFAYLFK